MQKIKNKCDKSMKLEPQQKQKRNNKSPATVHG